MSAGGATEKSYILTQIHRLQTQLEQVRDRHTAASALVASTHDQSVIQAIEAIRRQMTSLCEEASRNSIAKAER